MASDDVAVHHITAGKGRLSEVSSRYGLRPSEPGAVPGRTPAQHDTTRRTTVASAGHAG